MKDHALSEMTSTEEENEDAPIEIFWGSTNVLSPLIKKAKEDEFNLFDPPSKGSHLYRWDRGD